MLSLQGILELLNNRDNAIKNDITLLKCKEVYYGMSLHIDGILPAYRDLRFGVPMQQNQYVFNYYQPDWRFYQDIFELRLFSKYPREAEETRQYRFSQYKPFTKDPLRNCITTVTGALFQDSGYSIIVEDQEDNDYIWGNNFEGKNLAQYFAEKFQSICADPNGFFVVIPAEPGYATTTQKVQPKIYFIPTKSIIRINNDEIIFDLNEYTWAINGVGYFRFQKADGKYFHVDGQSGYYAHMMRDVPHVIAGGLWNMQGYYDSWLDAAKAIADEYVSAKSDEQLVMKDASFPYTIEASTDCPDCTGGQVQVCSVCTNHDCDCESDHTAGLNLKLIKCASCGGTGDKSRNPGERMIAPADEMDKDLIKIVNPETTINKLHIERNKELYSDMMRALHLKYIEQAQSGVAKDKDMETRYQFFSKIANDLFGRVVTKTLTYILKLRNVTNRQGVINPDTPPFNIVVPSQFNIYSSFDLLSEYKEATESKIPAYQLNAILDDFTDKRFGGNDTLKRKTHLIGQMDMLATYSPEQIQIALLNNAAEPRDYQFHLRLPMFLDEILREKGSEWFLSAKFEALKAEVDRKFALVKPAIPTIADNTIEETRVNV